MHNVNLEDMRLFVAVVQAGSLSQASDLTGIPVSKLSRRLTKLETALGTKIINRGKKGVSVNELGERFFSHAQEMLNHANLAVSSLNHTLQKPSGLLRVSVAVDVAYYVLAPILGEYLAMYPDVQVEVNLNQSKINMIQDGIDVAIRAGAVDNDNVIAKTLYPIGFATVASKQYLIKNGIPKTPNELYRHQLIVQTLLPKWHFIKENQSVVISPTAYLACNDFLFVAKMVSENVGISVVPMGIANANPDWVRILDDWQFKNNGFLSVVYYKNRGAVPTVRSFVDWLVGKNWA